MDIDIILEPDLDPKQINELGIKAEKYGINAIWTSNYFAHWDPFLSLVPLAQTTKKIKFGPLAVSPFEMHPLKIANSLISLNEMSQGRAQVAVGAGEGNITAMGLNTPKKIVLAVREALEIIIMASKNNLGDQYDGEIFSVNLPCDYSWANSSRPKVYGTAYKHMMMRMEGRIADGVYIGATPPEIISPAIENINIGIDKRTDDNTRVEINSFWAWHIKKDREESMKEARRELIFRGSLLPPFSLHHFLTDEEAQIVIDNYNAGPNNEFAKAYISRSGVIENVPEDLVN